MLNTPNVNAPGQRAARKRLSLKKDTAEALAGGKPNSHVGPPIEAHLREAMIRKAAYFRAVDRGFSPGLEIQDWLEAEAEVDRQLANGVRLAGL